MQNTLVRSVSFHGVGLHSGAPVTMVVHPADEDHGIWFRRTDLAANVLVPARWDAVVPSKLCTLIANAAGVSVSTIEHIMAALAGSAIHNALIDIDGPEVPILDGSSALFVAAFLEAGLQAQSAPVRAIKILKPVEVRDGAAVARLGDKTFAALAWVKPEEVLLAPEDRICVTMLEMLNIEGIVLEPAGALSVDVLPELADQIAGKTVVCVTSGGNFDFERLPEVKERAQRYSGVKKYFILRMPQRPGALKEFLSMLGPEDDIARFEYLKKSARNFGSVLIGIETTKAENFKSLFDQLEAAAFTYRDITNDEIL